MMPMRLFPAAKKGQYFSADAIIAAFIFVMALSLLTAQWFALRSQADSQSISLLEDANRVSDLLITVGNPDNWYLSPAAARSAGFAINGTRGGTLNQTMLALAGPAFSNMARYNQSKLLLALPVDYYIEFNLTSLDPAAPAYPSIDFPYIAIGLPPMHPTQKVQVYRGVVVPATDTMTPSTVYYYYGTMTVTLWTNRSNM